MCGIVYDGDVKREALIDGSVMAFLPLSSPPSLLQRLLQPSHALVIYDRLGLSELTHVYSSIHFESRLCPNMLQVMLVESKASSLCFMCCVDFFVKFVDVSCSH